MIDLRQTDSDDPEFMDILDRVIKALVDGQGHGKLYVTHIANWFDHKWLQFSGKTLGALGVWQLGESLTIPPFNPNRVVSQDYFARADGDSELCATMAPIELHVKISSGDNLTRRVSNLVDGAALLWYTGDTKPNQRGAIMVYAPKETGYEAWYASFIGDGSWRVLKTKEIGLEQFDAFLQHSPCK